jgi:hypothetical protein
VLAIALEKKDVIIPQIFETNKLTYDVNFDLQEYCAGAIHPKTNETITSYKKLTNNPLLQKTWMKAMCKELGNIAQGYEQEKRRNTVRFLTNHEIRAIPKDRKITYARIAINCRPQKDNPNCVRITVGGNIIDYPGKLTTCTANPTTTQLLWNSIINMPGTKYKTADINSFYLETPLNRSEYMHMPFNLISPKFSDTYKFHAMC